MIKIIIDCDPGVDDMEAILMAIASKNAEIIAITTVCGNSDSEQAYKNAINILSYCGINNIPVYKSTKCNLSGKEVCSDGFFGDDGLGNINLKNAEYKQEKMSSNEALNYYANKYPNEIHLLAVGPLTNLAISYLTDNKFPQKLASLYIMGGDVSETTKDNMTPFAEFNTYSDIFAWKLVLEKFRLKNNQLIQLLDLTACQKHVMPYEFLDKLYGLKESKKY